MSKYEICQEFFETNLPILFPNKVKIPNAYSLEDNNVQLLRDSYGIRHNGSTGNAAAIGQANKVYNIVIPLTREILRTDSNDMAIDEQVKILEDDASLLQSYVQNIYSSRNDANCVNWPEEILYIEQGSTSPVSFLIGEKANHILIEVDFNLIVTIDFYTP
jgi:hypothetical protein